MYYLAQPTVSLISRQCGQVTWPFRGAWDFNGYLGQWIDFAHFMSSSLWAVLRLCLFMKSFYLFAVAGVA